MNTRQIKKESKAITRRLTLQELMDVTAACLQYHGKDGDRKIITDVIAKTKSALKGIKRMQRVQLYPITSLETFIEAAWYHKSKYTAEELFKTV